MKVIEFPSASEFLENTETFLTGNEAANALILGYAINQAAGVESAMSTSFYAVEDGGQPVLAAMYTPDIWPALSTGDTTAAAALSEFFFAKYPDAQGAIGEKEVVNSFVEKWQELSGCFCEVRMRQRIYTCASVRQIELPDGEARQARAEDLDVVVDWRQAFHAELDMTLRGDRASVKSQLEQGRFFVWETDRPVSLAARGRQAGNGAVVNAVYTPPELRGQGYASGVVAAVTRSILDDGLDYAYLYTDLDNPTSNSLYQKIGYRPVGDSTLWRFTRSS